LIFHVAIAGVENDVDLVIYSVLGGCFVEWGGIVFDFKI